MIFLEICFQFSQKEIKGIKATAVEDTGHHSAVQHYVAADTEVKIQTQK